MKICDVVLDSVWWDPRVIRQIATYKQNNIDVCAVGIMDERYDASKIKALNCNVDIVEVDSKYCKKLKSVISKIMREYVKSRDVYRAICKTNANIIHANDLNALIPSYFASKKLKCKLVYDSHEIYIENNFLMELKLYKTILKIVERFLIKRADIVICVSHAAADYLGKMYNVPTPMVITNCAMKVDEKTLCTHEKTGHFEVLNHGGFYSGRGYDIMARTGKYLKEYKNIKLIIRGFGVQEDEIRKIDKEEGVGNFEIAPPVNVYELIQKASLSDVGVAITEPTCINFIYSVSNKIFEYAAAGLPVIMSDIPEHRYLNKKYDFGIVLKDNSPETLSKAIIELYDNSKLFEKYKKNALKMSKTLNWESEFGKLLKKYNEFSF